MPPPGAPNCEPHYWAEPGHEDPIAFCAKGKNIYVVTSGTVCGIYSSEARARRQISGVSNGRWRAAKNWPMALELWNESCNVYHETECPPSQSHPAPPSPPASPSASHPRMARAPGAVSGPHLQTAPPSLSASRLRVAPPPSPSTSRLCVVPSSSPSASVLRPAPLPSSTSVFQLCTGPLPSPIASHTTSVQSSTTARAPQTGPRSPVAASTSRAPASPLAMMDAVDAFARMGGTDSALTTRPPRQWVVRGVDIFFAERQVSVREREHKDELTAFFRIDALNHIEALNLKQVSILGSRNVPKLRAFIKGSFLLGLVVAFLDVRNNRNECGVGGPPFALAPFSVGGRFHGPWYFFRFRSATAASVFREAADVAAAIGEMLLGTPDFGKSFTTVLKKG
ncbi:hypothetical protein DFH08DRAFT_805387 [Mycena albidolilacea]|uniref:Uncharacterized protein n=1 Tax=Mycena albidolilacea TaxID=1033008 RepID=A0AAD7A8D9_9AGAR|nr:hypothetical protein DFH08DRAFT_805387 [Mycena albidolilacea]